MTVNVVTVETRSGGTAASCRCRHRQLRRQPGSVDLVADEFEAAAGSIRATTPQPTETLVEGVNRTRARWCPRSDDPDPALGAASFGRRHASSRGRRAAVSGERRGRVDLDDVAADRKQTQHPLRVVKQRVALAQLLGFPVRRAVR